METTNVNLLKTIDKIDSLINDQKEINRENICQILIFTMQFVETFPDLTGNDKKHIVFQAFEKVLEKTQGDNTLLLLLPNMIDSMINLDKGNVSIHLSPQTISCCMSIFACKKPKVKT